MKSLKKLFHKKTPIPPHKQVNNYLKQIRFEAKANLIQSYKTIASECVKKGQNPSGFIKQLSLRTSRHMKIHQFIKLLTIIHSLAIERKYNKQEIEGLQYLEVDFYVEDNEQWFQEFCESYISYLIKLPFMSDIYKAALSKDYPKVNSQSLTQIFRIINQISLLFPFLTKAIQTVGRYRAEQFPELWQFYRVISSQLVSIYHYLYYLICQVTQNFKKFDKATLQCFIKSLPQIQLTCDKIEDLLINKYIKGKKLGYKLQLKEENIAEIHYFLESQNYQIKI